MYNVQCSVFSALLFMFEVRPEVQKRNTQNLAEAERTTAIPRLSNIVIVFCALFFVVTLQLLLLLWNQSIYWLKRRAVVFLLLNGITTMKLSQLSYTFSQLSSSPIRSSPLAHFRIPPHYMRLFDFCCATTATIRACWFQWLRLFSMKQ